MIELAAAMLRTSEPPH
jgi:hypothetical protein